MRNAILGIGIGGLVLVIFIALALWANNPPPKPPTPRELEEAAEIQLERIRRCKRGPWGVPVDIRLAARGNGTVLWRPRRPYDYEQHGL